MTTLHSLYTSCAAGVFMLTLVVYGMLATVATTGRHWRRLMSGARQDRVRITSTSMQRLPAHHTAQQIVGLVSPSAAKE